MAARKKKIKSPCSFPPAKMFIYFKYYNLFLYNLAISTSTQTSPLKNFSNHNVTIFWLSYSAKHWKQSYLLSSPSSCSVIFYHLDMPFHTPPFPIYTLHFHAKPRSSLEVLHCQDPHPYLAHHLQVPSHTQLQDTTLPTPSHRHSSGPCSSLLPRQLQSLPGMAMLTTNFTKPFMKVSKLPLISQTQPPDWFCCL